MESGEFWVFIAFVFNIYLDVSLYNLICNDGCVQ